MGQKRTCAPQNAMSALPSIATAKADSHKRSCPLYPQERTGAVPPREFSIGVKPVRLPSGRDRLATNPLPTGSPTIAKTMGMVFVCCRIAAVAGVLPVRMRSLGLLRPRDKRPCGQHAKRGDELAPPHVPLTLRLKMTAYHIE